MSRCIDWLMFDFGTCRVFAQIVVVFPVLRGPDRSGDEAATAIWTDVVQNSVYTCGAKGALVGTDTRFK